MLWYRYILNIMLMKEVKVAMSTIGKCIGDIDYWMVRDGVFLGGKMDVTTNGYRISFWRTNSILKGAQLCKH